MTELIDYLKTYRDRYSFFNLLIPVFFGFFDDEDIFIASQSQSAWSEIGAVFELENEKDLKEELDYPVAPPQAWPSTTSRPTIGCRELVSRNLLGMMPGLARDAVDNLNLDNRIMATRVFALVISHCERNIHQHVPKVVEVITRGATDTCEKVRAHAASIAEWLCILSQPELVLKILLPGLEGFSLGTLVTLEKFAKTSNSAELIQQVISSFTRAMTCLTRDDRVIAHIRSTLFHAAKTANATSQLDIVSIELYCQALMTHQIEFNAKVFQTLSKKSKFSVPDMLQLSGIHFISLHHDSIKTWNQHSNEFHAWICLLHFASSVSYQTIFVVSKSTGFPARMRITLDHYYETEMKPLFNKCLI